MNIELRTDPMLLQLMEKAKETRLSRHEVRKQREAFVYGNLPQTQHATKADVRQALAKVEEES